MLTRLIYQKIARLLNFVANNMRTADTSGLPL